jgi:hypothetical protein
VLKDGATGLSEDVRSNHLAKDGDKYTEEGIYTVTVTNQYTGKSTTKKLYVGDNNILKAYITTGLTINEIQDRIAMGATIDDNGNIIDSDSAGVENEETPEEVTETLSEDAVEYTVVNENEQDSSEDGSQMDEVDDSDGNYMLIVIMVVWAVVIVSVGYYARRRKKNIKRTGGEE